MPNKYVCSLNVAVDLWVGYVFTVGDELGQFRDRPIIQPRAAINSPQTQGQLPIELAG